MDKYHTPLYCPRTTEIMLKKKCSNIIKRKLFRAFLLTKGFGDSDQLLVLLYFKHLKWVSNLDQMLLLAGVLLEFNQGTPLPV